MARQDLVDDLDIHSIFLIGDVIGKGLTGEVRMAVHRVSGQSVAIKRIKISEDVKIRRRMYREMALMKFLRHPYIVQVHQVIETREFIFIVMEWANGDMFDKLEKATRFDVSTALKYIKQIGEAVHYCHSLGIIHRDLKLENILIDASGNAKLADFGFAKMILSDMRPVQDCQALGPSVWPVNIEATLKQGNLNSRSIIRSVSFCGSVIYSSPEQCRLWLGQTQEYIQPQKSDIWSLGVILYAMLNGVMPVFAEQSTQVARLILSRRGHLQFYFPFPCAVVSLVHGMMAFDSSKRFTIEQVLSHECFAPAAAAQRNIPVSAAPPPMQAVVQSASPLRRVLSYDASYKTTAPIQGLDLSAVESLVNLDIGWDAHAVEQILLAGDKATPLYLLCRALYEKVSLPPRHQ